MGMLNKYMQGVVFGYLIGRDKSCTVKEISQDTGINTGVLYRMFNDDMTRMGIYEGACKPLPKPYWGHTDVRTFYAVRK